MYKSFNPAKHRSIFAGNRRKSRFGLPTWLNLSITGRRKPKNYKKRYW